MISQERTDGRTTKRKTDKPQAAGERPDGPTDRRGGDAARPPQQRHDGGRGGREAGQLAVSSPFSEQRPKG